MAQGKDIHLAELIQQAVDKKDLSDVRAFLSRPEYQAERWKALTNDADDAIVTIDPESGLFLDFNHRAAGMFEIDESEFGGLSVSDITPNEDHPWVWSEFRRILDENYVRLEEIPIVTQKGKRIYCDISASKMEIGGTAVIQAILHNITVRVELQLARNEYQKELEQKNLALEEARQVTSEFLATISHELRTPLNAIIGFNSLLEEGIYGDLSEPQLKAVDKVDTNATHLLRLIDQILQISRLEAGAVGVVKEDFDVLKSINKSSASYEKLFAEKNLELIFDPGYSELLIRTDEAKIGEILWQLLSNAMKFTEEGSVRIEVNADGNNFQLSVTDSGQGIPEDHLQFIFDLFRQGDATPTRRHPGAGIGLTMVRRLTNLLGGDIKVQSEVGKGTTFTLVLKGVVLRAIGSTEHVVSKQESEMELAPTDGVYSILVVDDDPYTVEVITEVLESEAGCRVRRAYSGMEAMLKMTEKKPHILVINLHAPHLNGLRILQYGYECWGEKAFKTAALIDKDIPDESFINTDIMLKKESLCPKEILRALAPLIQQPST